MSHNRSILIWICSLAVSVLTTGQGFCADASSASSVPETDKVVPLQSPSGGSVPALKVREANPYKNLHVPPPTEKYDPTRYSMNQTSSMAHKAFSSDSIAIAKKDADLTHDQTAFARKSYADTSPTDIVARTSQTRFSTSSVNDYNRGDTQDEKNYTSPNSVVDANRTSTFTSTSPDQNRTAVFGDAKTDVYSSGLAKQYTGPGAQKVRDGSVKENVVMAHVSDIPDHPLSIDEVRGLINHGFKPDENNKPDEPSKALNDPNYKPEASPEPPEAPMPPRAAAAYDDKNDPLPAPGTMSQPAPESTDPLPQH